MADDIDNEVLEQLDGYAKGIAHRILLKFNLAHDIHRGEDIAQELLIAGANVWHKTRDVALAKHRMSSRGNNEARNLFKALERQPQPLARLADSDGDDPSPPHTGHRPTRPGPWHRSHFGMIRQASHPMMEPRMHARMIVVEGS